MHGHRLHYAVRVECLCCHVDSIFTFKSPHDQVVCKGCELVANDIRVTRKRN